MAEKPTNKKILPKETGPKETGGAPGPDPVRYGDWERKGVAVDF